jgi:hypothetical protein
VTHRWLCPLLLFAVSSSLGCALKKSAYGDHPLLMSPKPKNTVQCEPVERWTRPEPPAPPPQLK